MTSWIAVGIQSVLFVGGLAGLYIKLRDQITEIKTRMDERDKGAADRVELDASRARAQAEQFCLNSCPRAPGGGNTNPRLRVYSGVIAPDEG